ncbi:MAG: DUF2147 domain-containing protein [Nitrospirota bacterium]
MGLINFVLMFFLFTSSYAFAECPDEIVGQWYTDGEKSLVEIYKCEDLYCGKIVRLKNPKDEEGKDKVDKNNPDESLRSRRLLGLPIAWGFRANGDNTWEGGKIYDPRNGKTYSCKIKFEGNKLKVRGYIGFSLFGRTTTWTKKT